VFTAITFEPNSGPRMPYWNGTERLNVETVKETMPSSEPAGSGWLENRQAMFERRPASSRRPAAA